MPTSRREFGWRPARCPACGLVNYWNVRFDPNVHGYSGMEDPHLDVRCAICGYEYETETKDRLGDVPQPGG